MRECKKMVRILVICSVCSLDSLFFLKKNMSLYKVRFMIFRSCCILERDFLEGSQQKKVL